MIDGKKMTIHFQRENVHVEMVGAQKKGKIMSKYLVIEWFPMQLNPNRKKEVMFIFKLFDQMDQKANPPC